MKLNDLVKQLKVFQEEYGNIDVRLYYTNQYSEWESVSIEYDDLEIVDGILCIG